MTSEQYYEELRQLEDAIQLFIIRTDGKEPAEAINARTYLSKYYVEMALNKLINFYGFLSSYKDFYEASNE